MTIDSASTPATACPACSAPVRSGMAFCEQCGARVDGAQDGSPAPAPAAAPAPPVRAVRKPTQAAAAAARSRAAMARGRVIEEERKAVRSARICMSIVAVLLIVLAMVSWSAVGGAAGEGAGTMRALVAANGLLGVVFFALVVWAGSNAFAAVLTGLVLWLSLQVAAAAINPLNLVSGIFFKVLIVVVLVGGIRAGLRQRRRAAEGSAAHAG